MIQLCVGRVPEDFRIAEVLEAEIEDGIALELGPGGSTVAAEGQVLGLLDLRVPV